MPARELFDRPNGEIVETYSGRTGQRKFEVVWANRYSEAPQLGDTWPGDEDLRVVRRHFQPITKKAGVAEYGYGFVTVEYSTRDRLHLDESMEVFHRTETIPWRLYFRNRDGSFTPLTEDEAETVDIVNPLITFTFETTKTYNPSRGLLGVVGKINKAPFKNFPAGTLLYQSSTVRKSWDSGGREFFIITHNLLYDCHGWNKMKRWVNDASGKPVSFTYEQVYPDIYEEDSFGLLQ